MVGLAVIRRHQTNGSQSFCIFEFSVFCQDTHTLHFLCSAVSQERCFCKWTERLTCLWLSSRNRNGEKKEKKILVMFSSFKNLTKNVAMDFFSTEPFKNTQLVFSPIISLISMHCLEVQTSKVTSTYKSQKWTQVDCYSLYRTRSIFKNCTIKKVKRIHSDPCFSLSCHYLSFLQPRIIPQSPPICHCLNSFDDKRSEIW